MRSYGLRHTRGTHPLTDVPLTDAEVCAVGGALIVGVWLGARGVVVWCALCAVAAMVARLGARWVGHVRALVVWVGLLLAIVGWALGSRAWAHTQPRQLGSYEGWAQVAADPSPYGPGLRLTVEVEGERFDLWAYGGRRARLAEAQAGEYLWVSGERTALGGGASARRAAVRHVVGRFELEVLGDRISGGALDRGSNRVRARLRWSAEHTMSAESAALFTGLVLGDDARQDAALVEAFRRSGLSHLTAVSGQNVAFVLAAALPVLRRLRPWWRWAGTVGTVGWFMAITRFEPSVLRAGAMAVLAATSFVLGLQATAVRLLALAVMALVIVDPLLVWSVGFWLSVGATAGVCVLSPRWHARLPGPVWLRLPLAVTLGAQVGVALPSLLVFGRLPLVSPLANLAAVPVAGVVMLYGLPAGLLAPGLPAPLRTIVMAPNSVGTRWVAAVARVGAAAEPSPGWALVGWTVLVLAWLVWHQRTRGRAGPPAPLDGSRPASPRVPI